MINDKQMLQFIMKNAEMGCRGINDVKHYSNTAEISKALRAQNEEYGNIYHNAFSMLRNIGAKSSHVNPFVASMAKAKARHDLRGDSSDSYIAEMMIQGNVMGVRKIAQHIRQYGGSNKSVMGLADKLMSTQQANIEEMKSFL